VVPAAAGVLLVFAAMQLVPVAPRTNPRVDASRTVFARVGVGPKAAAIVERACANCHSNATVWPWYSAVAPMSWLLATHVNEGRRAMNLSEWPRDPAASVAALTLACADMESGHMPPASYRMLHPESRVTPAEAAAFCGWAEQTTTRILAGK
jgi:hypothetical protein